MFVLAFYRTASGHSHQPKDRVGDYGELNSFCRKNQDFLFLKNFAPLRLCARNLLTGMGGLAVRPLRSKVPGYKDCLAQRKLGFMVNSRILDL